MSNYMFGAFFPKPASGISPFSQIIEPPCKLFKRDIKTQMNIICVKWRRTLQLKSDDDDYFV